MLKILFIVIGQGSPASAPHGCRERAPKCTCHRRHGFTGRRRHPVCIYRVKLAAVQVGSLTRVIERIFKISKQLHGASKNFCFDYYNNMAPKVFKSISGYTKSIYSIL